MPESVRCHFALAHRTKAGRDFDLDIAFEFGAGMTALFGPSGAGKTSCLEVIAGLRAPSRGSVSIGSETLTDTSCGRAKPPHLRGVGLVFQSLALFPHLDAEENVAFGLDRSLSGDVRRTKALSWLERLSVGHLGARKPRTFSGGEAQRVAIARALAAEPRVLLLDEPFNALDETFREKTADDVRALVLELGVPTLLVTHLRAEARRLCDRAIVLEQGRVVAAGATKDLLVLAA